MIFCLIDNVIVSKLTSLYDLKSFNYDQDHHFYFIILINFQYLYQIRVYDCQNHTLNILLGNLPYFIQLEHFCLLLRLFLFR